MGYCSSGSPGATASCGRGGRELEAAARVDEVSSNERAVARELLGNLASPLDGSAGVSEAVAAMKRLEADRPSKEFCSPVAAWVLYAS